MKANKHVNIYTKTNIQYVAIYIAPHHFFSYIFHIKPDFFKKLLQSHFLSDYHKICTVKQKFSNSFIIYSDTIF